MDYNNDALVDLGFVLDADGSLRFEDLVIPPAPIPALSSDVPLTRLIITHLTVHNFKSYAGEQVIGPFDKNFTAVVGPNGSGKSNVIDALMFVFGRKSRDIRAKKLTNLIHNSAKFRDCQFCSVTVNFQMISDETSTGLKAVKGSGFNISRTVRIDGQAYYEICHQRKTYAEVVRTLRQYGIDMEYNRFLIMQGEIESIALMEPKATPKESSGMLEYIEDIVGSHRLIEPIKYFQAKAEELKVQEKEKAGDVALFEKAKKELEGPKDQALGYLRLENKRVLCENSILLAQRRRFEHDLEGVIDTKKKFLEEVASLKTQMAEVKETKKKIESAHAEMMAKRDEISKKHEKYKKEFDVLIQQDAANLLDMKHIRGKIETNKKQVEEIDKELKKIRKQLAIYESETEELEKRRDTLQKEKSIEETKSTEVMGNLKQETKMMQEQKDVLEGSLVKLKDNDQKIKSEMDLIKSELRILESNDKQEKEKLSSLESNLKKHTDTVNKEEGLMQEEAKQVTEIENELASFKEQLAQAKTKEATLSQQSREARQKFDESRRSQQDSRNSSSLLKGLLKAKADGKLPKGIYGRLGDLGAIDQKYVTAMSIACGRLDNLVTDNLETAQKCVEYLKKYNLGYANFIALDQQKRFKDRVGQKVVTPENVPRLFDLLRVKDKELLPAFYFAIGETLVANDLDQATRIGMAGAVRHRVVTLIGELVESSGAMVGGGKASYIQAKIGQQVVEAGCSDEELRQMADIVKALTQELSEVKESQRALSDKISQRTTKLNSLGHSLKKRTQNLDASKVQVKMITSQIAEQKDKMKGLIVDDKKVSELEEKIKAKNKIYKKSVEETSVVEKQVMDLQAKILELSKGKMTKAQKTKDQIQKKWQDVNNAITKSTVNIKQSNTKIAKLEKRIKVVQEELVDNEKQLKTLKEKEKDFTERGAEATAIKGELELELKGYVDKEKDFRDEIKAIDKQEQEFKKTEVDQKNTMKTYEATESEKRANIKSIKAKLTKLKLTVVEDDPTDIPVLSDEEIAKLDIRSLRTDLDVMTVQLEDTTPNLNAIKEFKEKDKIYQDKYAEFQVLKKCRTLQEQRKLELDKKRLKEFMKAFAIICVKVKEVYMMLTDGGDAELQLLNSRDPFDKGIRYSVRPPKKAWKAMSHLSGGEKTLSSLALVFSLHYYRTTPFYVMDEIDAALDERNVAIIGKYLRENQKNAQFIIVSLRNVMNELPDKLLGVIKVDSCTKNIHLTNAEKWTEKNDKVGPSELRATTIVLN